MSVHPHAGRGVAELEVGEVLPVLDSPGRPWEFDLFEKAVDSALGVADENLSPPRRGGIARNRLLQVGKASGKRGSKTRRGSRSLRVEPK